MWCDIELLKRAIVLRFLPLFFCYTLRTAAKYVPKPYILCLSSLRLASFLRVTSPTTHLGGLGFFSSSSSSLLPAASTQKLSILHTAPHMHRRPNFPNEISDAQPAIFAFGGCVMFFFFFSNSHTQNTHPHTTHKKHTHGGKKNNTERTWRTAHCASDTTGYYPKHCRVFFPSWVLLALQGFGV